MRSRVGVCATNPITRDATGKYDTQLQSLSACLPAPPLSTTTSPPGHHHRYCRYQRCHCYPLPPVLRPAVRCLHDLRHQRRGALIDEALQQRSHQATRGRAVGWGGGCRERGTGSCGAGRVTSSSSSRWPSPAAAKQARQRRGAGQPTCNGGMVVGARASGRPRETWGWGREGSRTRVRTPRTPACMPVTCAPTTLRKQEPQAHACGRPQHHGCEAAAAGTSLLAAGC